jgi:hypothetical protein
MLQEKKPSVEAALEIFPARMRKKEKTPQIPCVSVSCNPQTVEPTHTFQEQLIVVEN